MLNIITLNLLFLIIIFTVGSVAPKPEALVGKGNLLQPLLLNEAGAPKLGVKFKEGWGGLNEGGGEESKFPLENWKNFIFLFIKMRKFWK